MLDWFNYHGHMCIAFEMLGLSVFDFLVSILSVNKLSKCLPRYLYSLHSHTDAEFFNESLPNINFRIFNQNTKNSLLFYFAERQ